MTSKTTTPFRRHARLRTGSWATLAGIAAIGAVALFAVPAHAQSPDNQALLDRMERLERDIRTLNQQIARQGAAAQAPATLAPAAQSADADAAVNSQPTAGGPGDAPQSAVARAFVRLDALEREVRDLTGMTEGLSFRIDQLNARLDKLLVDLDFRLARLEGTQPGSFSAEARGETQPPVNTAPTPGAVTRAGSMPPVGGGQGGTVAKDGTYVPGEGEQVGTLGTVSKSKIDAIVGQPDAGDGPAVASAAPDPDQAPAQDGQDAQAAPQAATQTAPMADAPVQETVPTPAEQQQAAAPSVLPAGTVREQYDFAWDLIRQARFVEAEEAFKAFIAAHPEAELTDNARYWLGETYYVRKRYMDAAQAFFDAYKQAPEGNKAPDALLKLGMSMAGLDKAEEACTTFAKLRKEFTPLKANIEQALNREVQRLKCK